MNNITVKKIDAHDARVKRTIKRHMNEAGLSLKGQPDNEGVMAIENLLILGCDNYHVNASLSDCEKILAINTGRTFTAIDVLLRRTLAKANCEKSLKSLFTNTVYECGRLYGVEVSSENDDTRFECYARRMYGKNYRKKFDVRSAKEMLGKVYRETIGKEI